jgi:hypothetical protein
MVSPSIATQYGYSSFATNIQGGVYPQVFQVVPGQLTNTQVSITPEIAQPVPEIAGFVNPQVGVTQVQPVPAQLLRDQQAGITPEVNPRVPEAVQYTNTQVGVTHVQHVPGQLLTNTEGGVTPEIPQHVPGQFTKTQGGVTPEIVQHNGDQFTAFTKGGVTPEIIQHEGGQFTANAKGGVVPEIVHHVPGQFTASTQATAGMVVPPAQPHALTTQGTDHSPQIVQNLPAQVESQPTGFTVTVPTGKAAPANQPDNVIDSLASQIPPGMKIVSTGGGAGAKITASLGFLQSAPLPGGM